MSLFVYVLEIKNVKYSRCTYIEKETIIFSGSDSYFCKMYFVSSDKVFSVVPYQLHSIVLFLLYFSPLDSLNRFFYLKKIRLHKNKSVFKVFQHNKIKLLINIFSYFSFSLSCVCENLLTRTHTQSCFCVKIEETFWKKS